MQHENREGLCGFFLFAWVCTDVFAWLHVNLISRKHRGDVCTREVREIRWKKRGGFWCVVEKNIPTIPVWRFPWQQWHHRRNCLGFEWKNVERTCAPSSVLVSVWGQDVKREVSLWKGRGFTFVSVCLCGFSRSLVTHCCRATAAMATMLQKQAPCVAKQCARRWAEVWQAARGHNYLYCFSCHFEMFKFKTAVFYVSGSRFLLFFVFQVYEQPCSS